MIFAILLTFTAVFGYFFSQYSLNYWRRNGIKQLEPKFIFGDAYSLLTSKTSMGEFFQGLYTKYKNSKVLGVYISYKPVLLVNDPKVRMHRYPVLNYHN